MKSIIVRDKYRFVNWVCFFVVVIMFAFFNLNVPVMRSLPDELGSMAFAAFLNGEDWSSVLSNPSMFYGSGQFFLLYPIFLIAKNPIIKYQLLLAVGSILKSIPIFIAGKIVRYYKHDISIPYYILIIISTVLFSPIRATNIDNEPMLTLLVWIIVLLIIRLQRNINKEIDSIVLGIVCGYGYFCHTRGLLYVIAILSVILIFRILTNKELVYLNRFIISVFITLVLAYGVNAYIKAILYTNASTEITTNTVGSLATSVLGNFRKIFTFVGFQSFLDLLCSNIWVIYIFGLGIISFSTFIILYKLLAISKKRISGEAAESESYVFPGLFCVIGLIASIVGLCIWALNEGIQLHTDNGSLTRFHFYLRYYANYFGPMILVFYTCCLQKTKEKSLCRLSCITAVILNIGCILYSFFGPATISIVQNERFVRSDWFYYFAPFSFNFQFWPNAIQGRKYYVISTIVVTALVAIIWYLAKKRKTIYLLFLLNTVFIWEYGYGVIQFDKPFSTSRDYYESVNGFTDYVIENKNAIHDKRILYINETFGPQYLVQFASGNTPVDWMNHYPNEDQCKEIKSEIVLSNQPIDGLDKMKSVERIDLDDNEYLYILKGT